MIKEYMLEDIPDAIIERLLEHVWFQNIWDDLEEQEQDIVFLELRDVIAEWLDEDYEKDDEAELV